jgi:hypothetical protein
MTPQEAGTGGQDGPHVGGALSAERDRAVPRRVGRLFAAAPVMNASATGPRAQNSLIATPQMAVFPPLPEVIRSARRSAS